MTYQDILKNEEVNAYIQKGNANLDVLGFTDHSQAHSGLVAQRAAEILEKLGYSEREMELAKIAGYMHDIGNVINRKNHAEYGAILANDILKETDMPLSDRVTVVSAIGNHDEGTGGAKDAISAALIIADKTDVRRNRVTEKETAKFDIHDRVNYAVTNTELTVDAEKMEITLHLEIDETISEDACIGSFQSSRASGISMCASENSITQSFSGTIDSEGGLS
ncbi:MAG: HD domain-containing protein, partial [Lachnospiraceae bacterium]|nr:HD domain-containing protein [Lachnospiraceae bacterium]